MTGPGGVSWLVAVLIAAAVSAVLSYVVNSQPIPPGGDPGTWISTGIGYLGGNHPSQVVPLAYPPVLFPMLGGLVLLTGSPITAAQVFVPLLYFSVGLSVYYLATQVLRSRLVALGVMGFVMIDPQLLQMIFWGAYPNLLAFVFLDLALAGLVRLAQGATSQGAFMFWVFGALTVLTHSLAALVLGGSFVLFVLLSWAVPSPSRSETQTQGEAGESDVPARVRREVFFSKGGTIGCIIFILAVGAYYLVTSIIKVPHPDYFVSNPLAFRVIGLGGVFHAVLPGVNLLSLEAVYLLTFGVIALLLWYAIVLLYKVAWLTTPVLLLLAIGVTVMMTPVVGWILRIVTDYTRFGFFLLIPTALAIGYMIDRGWISARDRSPPPKDPPQSGSPAPLPSRWLRNASHPPRLVTFAVVAFVAGILIATGITIPAMWRSEAAFTQVGHNQAFLNALSAIQATGQPGSILTVPGADKWARAITDRNVYAPYAQATYLFYQSQVLDSDLSYYALTSRYAVTNGLVTAYVKGVQPANLNGTPSYGAYVVGDFRPILSAPPYYMSVELVGATNHTAYSVPVSGSPLITLPTSVGGPMQLTYIDPSFIVDIDAVIATDSAQFTLTYNLYVTGSDLARALNVTLIPSAYTTALLDPGSIPGEFFWETVTRYVGPLTFGNVTPVSALEGVLPLDPRSSTPAVLLSYPNASSSGGRDIQGHVTLTTPAASTLFNVLPPLIVTTYVWSELDIRFVLMRNPAFAPSPNVAFPGETQYLVSEYNATAIYSNTEWTVLELP
jgi:hypothetical protein